MPTDVFAISANTNDAYGTYSGATWPPATTFTVGSTASIISASHENAAGFLAACAVMRWDTSSIPDGAIISAASLDLYCDAKNDADGRSIALEWYDYGGDAMTSADWALEVTTSIGTKTLASFTAGNITTTTISNFTGINVSGFTGIRICLTGGSPAGSNWIDFASFDHATGQEPRLSVTYTTGGYWLVP